MVGNRPYLTVLKDLEKRRESQIEILNRVTLEIGELDQLISGLKKVAITSTHASIDPSPNSPSKPHPSMSMRWAILNILGRSSNNPLSVGDVVEALKAMAFPDNSKLRGNASAVLSRMGGLGEVVNTGNSYSITEVGLRSLEFIQLKNAVVATEDNNMHLYSSSGAAAEDDAE